MSVWKWLHFNHKLKFVVIFTEWKWMEILSCSLLAGKQPKLSQFNRRLSSLICWAAGRACECSLVTLLNIIILHLHSVSSSSLWSVYSFKVAQVKEFECIYTFSFCFHTNEKEEIPKVSPNKLNVNQQLVQTCSRFNGNSSAMYSVIPISKIITENYKPLMRKGNMKT